MAEKRERLLGDDPEPFPLISGVRVGPCRSLKVPTCLRHRGPRCQERVPCVCSPGLEIGHETFGEITIPDPHGRSDHPGEQRRVVLGDTSAGVRLQLSEQRSRGALLAVLRPPRGGRPQATDDRVRILGSTCGVLELIERIGHDVPSAKTRDAYRHCADHKRSERICARLELEASNTSNHVVDLSHIEQEGEDERRGRLSAARQTTDLLVDDVLTHDLQSCGRAFHEPEFVAHVAERRAPYRPCPASAASAIASRKSCRPRGSPRSARAYPRTPRARAGRGRPSSSARSIARSAKSIPSRESPLMVAPEATSVRASTRSGLGPSGSKSSRASAGSAHDRGSPSRK